MVAIAFDPKSPASIAIPRYEDDDGGGGNENVAKPPLVFSVDRATADQGVGCNKFESSAVTSMIEARDEYLNMYNNTTSGHHHQQEHTLAGLRHLSHGYRSALSVCIDHWTDDQECRRNQQTRNRGGVDDEDDEEEDEMMIKEEMDRSQIQMFYAVVHLSEIYLLIPDSSSPFSLSSSMSLSSPVGALGTGDLMNTMMGGSYTAGRRMSSPTSTFSQDNMEIPGGVSADTVRYLRLHHLGPAEGMFSDDVVETIKTLEQPDQWNDGVDYWKLVIAHAIRGCLDDVWDLLTHHSTYRRLEIHRRAITLGTEENNGDAEHSYQTQWLLDVDAGFEALKYVLLSAPIPAGRNSNTDRDGPLPDDDDGGENSPLDDSDEIIEGVRVGVYKLWDKTNSPSFDPQAAYEAFQVWQEFLKEHEPLQKIRSRIRPIDQLLSLLGGEYQQSSHMFESWQEELCADILYKVPNIRPIDMNVRAKDAQDNYGSADEAASEFDKLILSIMRGNAGSAIQGLYQVLGGDKGAALPAVTTSLLAQLLSDAQVLDSSPESTELLTDLLIDAASAIRSSLSSEGRDDLGVRLVVQLLLPYVSKVGCDVRMTANMVDAIEHHSPNSDTEAKDLLSLCHNLVERKNVRVLDACSSICLARHAHYLREQQPAGATFWLAKGMHYESLVLCDGHSQNGSWVRKLSTGACYQRLVTYFSTTAQALLSGLCGDAEGTSVVVVRAEQMIQPGLDDSPLAGFISEVKVLKSVLAMAQAVHAGDQDESVASCIIACLEEKPDEEDDGAVSCLASPCMHWNLLRLAVAIMERDVTRSDETSCAVSSFDVRGMGVLFATLTVLKASADIAPKNTTPEWAENLHEAGAAFADALKRAFIVENASRRKLGHTKSRTPTRGVYSSNFNHRPREEQERVVKTMLEY